MYQNNINYPDNRIQDFWREYRQSATFYGLPAAPGVAHKVRQGAGQALIALGAWIKPRRSKSNMATAWGGR